MKAWDVNKYTASSNALNDSGLSACICNVHVARMHAHTFFGKKDGIKKMELKKQKNAPNRIAEAMRCTKFSDIHNHKHFLYKRYVLYSLSLSFSLFLSVCVCETERERVPEKLLVIKSYKYILFSSHSPRTCWIKEMSKINIPSGDTTVFEVIP